MKFPKKQLRLLSVRTIRKDNKEYSFVKLADEATFENNDFMLGRDMKPGELVANTRYDVVLEVDGKFTSVELFPVGK